MDNTSQNRIKNIYQMLFEMATGNLAFRLLQTGQEDELDRMAKALNTVASEMRAAILKSGYVNPHYSYQNTTQAILLIDIDFRVMGYNAEAIEILGYHSKALLKKDFNQLLTHHSQQLWDTLKDEMQANKNFHTTIHLLFHAKDRKVIPLFCTVSSLTDSNTIVISSITTVLQDLLFDNFSVPSAVSPKKSAAALAQAVYDHILGNLEEPLPSVGKLAMILGTNEYTLKESFRHFFHTSIYRFYTDQRLKKAHHLIRHTTIPIKEIAFMSGFNDYANFSKSFKKNFGYSPSSLKRADFLS